MGEVLREQTAWGWLGEDCVARHARSRPDKVACLSPVGDRRMTYAQLDEEIGRCAGYLKGVLKAPDARVAVIGRNALRHLLLFYACARIGAVLAPLNWRLSAPELAVILGDCEPELLFYDEEFAAAAEAASDAAPVGARIACDPAGATFDRRIAGAPTIKAGGTDPLAPCTLLYTSGTTGRPKGVIVTPRSGFASAFNFCHLGEVDSGSTMLLDSPMFHVLGLLAIMHASLQVGGTVVISDRFDPGLTLRRLSDPELNVTHFFGAPQMAQVLSDEPGFKAAALPRLKGVFTGGAPLAPSLVEAYLDHGLLLVNGYGMTESGSTLGMPLDPAIIRRKIASAGLPGPAMEVRTVDPEGRDTATGEAGEIWLRGPGVTPGYWGQAEITAKAFCGGWFQTGDAGRRDADGFYYVVDRWKDMYITGGENVYPAEVEAVLVACPPIADAAVIGVPDARWGETGCAYVAVYPGQTLTAEAVIGHCGQRLAGYKRPRHVRFIDAIPRSAAGKILKDVLRRRFADEAALPTESGQ